MAGSQLILSKGADKPWNVPNVGGWHWDGIQLKHFVDSPDQGHCACAYSRKSVSMVEEHDKQRLAQAGEAISQQYPDGIELEGCWFRYRIGVTHGQCSRRIQEELRIQLKMLIAINEKMRLRNQLLKAIESREIHELSTDSEGVKLRVLETTGLQVMQFSPSFPLSYGSRRTICGYTALYV